MAARAMMRTAAAALMLALPALRLYAQQEASAPDGVDYSYVVGPDGTPHFTQRIRWQADPNALRYEIVLWEPGGGSPRTIPASGDSVELSLEPGEYAYELVVYNVLGQVEQSSGPIALSVVRAEQPRITEVEPGRIYIESGGPRILRVAGERLKEGAEVALVDLSDRNRRPDLAATVRERRGDGALVVEFPSETLEFGEYALRVRNPGGLAASSDRPIKVAYQKPVDLYASIGYAPEIPLYDGYFRENWPAPFFPSGAEARLGVLFLKRRTWRFGAELVGLCAATEGGQEDATIRTAKTAVGTNALFSRKLGAVYRGVIRLGGGVSRAEFGFDYEGTSGDSLITDDPYAAAGVAFQRSFGTRFYAEIGAEWRTVFRNGYQEGTISPRIALGYYR